MVVRNVTIIMVPANYYGMLVVWREELANAMVHQARGDINAKTKRGNTALHLACATVKWAMVRALAQSRADISATDSDGRSCGRSRCKYGPPKYGMSKGAEWVSMGNYHGEI